jgi:hypothetical protein
VWRQTRPPNRNQYLFSNPGFFEIGNRLRVDYVIIHEGWNRSDDTNVPPNYKLISRFKTQLAGDAVYLNPGSDLVYQRVTN